MTGAPSSSANATLNSSSIDGVANSTLVFEAGVLECITPPLSQLLAVSSSGVPSGGDDVSRDFLYVEVRVSLNGDASDLAGDGLVFVYSDHL